MLEEEKFLLIFLDLCLYLSLLSSTKEADLTESDEESIQMSVQELCADEGMAVADFIQHLQTSQQDAENTAVEKEWHCIVQSMTDQHGMPLECMIQEKNICIVPHENKRNYS